MVDPLTVAGLAMGGIQAVSSMFAGGMDVEDNERLMDRANEFNSNQAKTARDWSERMSNTAYQRSRADMEAAGINPMLAATQGGASTPGATSASSVAPPQTHARENAISNVLASAKDMMSTIGGLDKMRADTKEADTRATVNAVMADKVVQDTKTSGASAKNLEAQNNLIKAQTDVAQKQATQSRIINKGYGLVERMVNGVSSGISNAKSRMFSAERFNTPSANMRER